jgi:hypothetical protein
MLSGSNEIQVAEEAYGTNRATNLKTFALTVLAACGTPPLNSDALLAKESTTVTPPSTMTQVQSHGARFNGSATTPVTVKGELATMSAGVGAAALFKQRKNASGESPRGAVVPPTTTTAVPAVEVVTLTARLQARASKPVPGPKPVRKTFSGRTVKTPKLFEPESPKKRSTRRKK